MKLNSFDKLVVGVLLLLLLGIASILWIDRNIGVRIIHTRPTPGHLIPITSDIGFTFSEAMDPNSVIHRIVFEPSATGNYRWEEKTLWFSPHQPWSANQNYQVTIQPGAQSINGHSLKKEYVLSFTTRSPRIVYISSAPNDRELWMMNGIDASPQQVTYTGGRLFDYAIAPMSGNLIYTVLNTDGSSDLMMLDGNSLESSLLFACFPDRCSTPSWSPDESKLAYSRAAGLSPGSFGLTRIWVLDLISMETSPLFAEAEHLGYGPSWSPDGKRLAYFNPLDFNILIVNLGTNETFSFTSSTNLAGGWSPDGTMMIYNEIISDTTGASLLVADLIEEDIRIWLNIAQLEANRIGTAVWSPDGRWIAFSAGFQNGGAGNQLWYMPYHAQYGQVIMADQRYFHSHYAWHPSSLALLIQRHQTRTAYSQTELVYWSMVTGKTHVIAQGSEFPGWLP